MFQVNTKNISQDITAIRTIHLVVALCDNKSQGIVPVPDKIGNGDDPANNLYWGALYGVKTFFQRSKSWDLVASEKNIDSNILERLIFKHRKTGSYFVADAYQGKKIKVAIRNFFEAAAGEKEETIEENDIKLNLYGKADLVAYIGHNCLMEFRMEVPERVKNKRERAAFVLACASKYYFHSTLSSLGCKPLLLTTGLMAPEAYTLEAALEAWLTGGKAEDIKVEAARAYSKYQKCGEKSALNLFYVE